MGGSTIQKTETSRKEEKDSLVTFLEQKLESAESVLQNQSNELDLLKHESIILGKKLDDSKSKFRYAATFLADSLLELR